MGQHPAPTLQAPGRSSIRKAQPGDAEAWAFLPNGFRQKALKPLSAHATVALAEETDLKPAGNSLVALNWSGLDRMLHRNARISHFSNREGWPAPRSDRICWMYF